jgi:uncharacterized protein (DUF1501 family)
VTLTRRQFLRGGLATALLLPGTPRLARAATGNRVLLALFLRGGADGLSLVVPAGDPDYYALRPAIGVPSGSGIDLDGFFAFHPALAPLAKLFRNGELAALHAVGGTPGLRSHFEAQDAIERAASGPPRADGWLNRALAALAAGEPWAGITLGDARALSLEGAAPNLALASLSHLARGDRPLRRPALEAMYASAPASLAGAAREAFAALDTLRPLGTANTAAYPLTRLGAALAEAAVLIRADVGVRCVAIDVDGWDHHKEGAAAIERSAAELAAALRALRADLGAHWQRCCVLAMTEFGRAAAENGALGTDHGAGSVMLAAGGSVRGGQVLTRSGWPGLAPAALFEGRDLAVTTDFRDVFAEVLHRHLGLPLFAVVPVLPGHSLSPANFPGLFA